MGFLRPDDIGSDPVGTDVPVCADDLVGRHVVEGLDLPGDRSRPFDEITGGADTLKGMECLEAGGTVEFAKAPDGGLDLRGIGDGDRGRRVPGRGPPAQSRRCFSQRTQRSLSSGRPQSRG